MKLDGTIIENYYHTDQFGVKRWLVTIAIDLPKSELEEKRSKFNQLGKIAKLEVDNLKSIRQNNFYQALAEDIAELTGYTKDEVKEIIFKGEIAERVGFKFKSWGKVRHEDATKIINEILAYCSENNIPLEHGVEFFEAKQKWNWCLYKKQCLVCGKPADLHHLDAVGMGRDRTQLTNPVLAPFCRVHHDDIHGLGKKKFMELNHLQDFAEFIMEMEYDRQSI